MCGIVGYVGSRQAAPILLDGLRRLEYRGYDSAGMAVCGPAGLQVYKTPGRLAALAELTADGAALTGTVGVGHTRWATHGEPNQVNAHPQTSGDGRFAVVHNGIIENFARLKAQLIQQGYTFRSETDTEVVAQLLSFYYDRCGDVFEAVNSMLSAVEGAYALGIVCADTPDRVIAARKDAPLLLGCGRGENFLASDVTALLPYTRDVIYMDDGELAVITASGIRLYDERRRPMEKPHNHIDWDVAAAEKGGYPHFMLKEIYEQPDAVRRAITGRIRDGRVLLSDLTMTDEDIHRLGRILIIACGSSYHVGMVGKYTLERLLRRPVEVCLASEFRYSDPLVSQGDLVIVISQSGETLDSMAALREAKKRGARVLSIVNVVGSSIARESDDVLYTWAGPEIAVATTKGYTTQVAVMDMLAVYLARRLGRLDDAQNKELVDAILQFPSLIQRSIDLNPNLPALAEKYHSHNDVFFIGRNLDYAASMEGSLKLKEISYLHSEAYAAGELKHGTIALIEKGRPVVALACYETLFDKMMSNIKEVKARGAQVLAVVLEGNRQIFAEADDVIFVPRTKEIFNTLPEIVPLQLFAYYVAKANGCAIDKPKNLAKSVTVE